MSTETLGTSSTSPHLLERIEHMYVAARCVIDALPAERFAETLPSGWRLRDVVAHLAAWEETVPPRVEVAIATGTDSFDRARLEDIDAFNATVVASSAHATPDELRARLAASHERLVELVRSFEGRTVPTIASEIVEWNTTGHYPDHFADLSAAIQTPADLLAVVAQGWQRVRLAVVAMGAVALDRTTPTGWTYKDLVAHVAAWEDRTASRLAAFRESGGRTVAGVTDTDEFNAAVVARTKARSAREVRGDLEAAHARLVAEIGRLEPAHLRANDGWVLAVVAGNSYGHYAEHEVELMAAVPATPAELHERMGEEWRPFRRSVTRAGLLPLSRTTSAGWTAKAMLAHLAYWMETVPDELPRRLAGERPSAPDVQAANAKTAAAAATRTADEIVRRLDDAYASARAAVDASADGPALPFGAVGFVAVETYGHWWKHAPELDELLPRTTAEVLARFDASWSAFRTRVRDIGRAGLLTATSAGWTYRDLCAHLANWMQNAASELESGSFRSWSTEQAEAENQRAVAAHQLVGAEAMLDELDSSQRRVRAVIASLSDDRIRERRVGTVVAFYTYLAWEEHFAELGVRT